VDGDYHYPWRGPTVIQGIVALGQTTLQNSIEITCPIRNNLPRILIRTQLKPCCPKGFGMLFYKFLPAVAATDTADGFWTFEANWTETIKGWKSILIYSWRFIVSLYHQENAESIYRKHRGYLNCKFAVATHCWPAFSGCKFKEDLFNRLWLKDGLSKKWTANIAMQITVFDAHWRWKTIHAGTFGLQAIRTGLKSRAKKH